MGAHTTVLVTGATGFLGRALIPWLTRAGFTVRAGSRRPDTARGRAPEHQWVGVDLENPSTLDAALAGIDVAFHLVHGMSDGPGYAEREARGARAFAAACARSGVSRIVYMGGVDPDGPTSPHLASRVETGRILRAGAVPVLELRAGMIAGPGSASWQIVSDLARRLPVAATGDWLDRCSWPVFVDDICAALTFGAQDLRLERSAWYDAPGPERIAHGALIHRVMRAMGRRVPAVPLPRVPRRWAAPLVSLLSSAEEAVALELIEGLRHDLDPSGRTIWSLMGGYRPTGLDETIRRCL